MLVGEYRSKIGDKKRVAVPKKIRDDLGDDLILTRGYENALVIVNKDMWRKIAGEIIDGSFINQNIRETSRFLVGSATELTPDNQGRIVIPTGLYEYASFTEEVVFVGLVNWVELWDKAKWEERMEYLAKNSEQIAQELAKANNHGE